MDSTPHRAPCARAVLCLAAVCLVAAAASAQEAGRPRNRAAGEGRATQRETEDRPDDSRKGVRRSQRQEGPKRLPEVRVTAFRGRRDRFELPRNVTTVDREDLERADEASVLDAFNRRIGIWIEKRTATTSDPVIRGLSGANILTLIDGDPLTTFWGEGGFAGDDMYGKIEAESIERIEVIRGPASVLYGSNALGGVILVHTRPPSLEYPEAGLRYGGRAKVSFNSVNQGKMTRVDVEGATPDLRFRLGGTWRDLSDGSGGRGVSRLVPSGGKDLNYDLAADYRLDDEGRYLRLSLQQVTRRDIVRFYRPTQRNENDRTGVSLRYVGLDPDGHEGVEGRLYYQWKEDRRLFSNGNVGVAQWATWNTDWTLRGEGPLEDSDYVTGLTLRLDTGQSPDDEQFTIYTPSGGRAKAAPDQEWWNFAWFGKGEWQFARGLSLTASLRYDRFLYFARPDAFYNPPGGRPELDRIKDWQHSVTGGVGLVWAPADEWRAAASWSRGFRTFPPHFGITKHGWGVLVPTGLLEPIEADNYELTLRYRRPGASSQLVGYYTNFDGFQNIVAGSFNGQTYYDYNGNGSFENDERVFVTTGNGRAVLYGVEWEARVEPWRWWRVLPEGSYVRGGFMWNYGRDLTNREPMRHTHPARGLLVLGYEEPEDARWYVELTADFVHAFTRIPPARLASDVGYRTNPQDPSSPLVRSDGLPGYTVYDLSAGWRPRENVRVGLNLENLTNKNYRPAHSRMDAFGFSARLFVELTF